MSDGRVPLRIGGATVNQLPLDWEGNLKNILDAIDEGRNQSIDMLCFPELCVTGYGCEDLFLSTWLPDKALAQLPKIVQATEQIAVAVGLPVIFEGKTYNCTCVIQDQKILGIVAKQNLPVDGVHYETRWFSEWESDRISQFQVMDEVVPFGDVTFDIKGYTFGFEICEDAWREDRPACNLVTRGVDVICNPSASHFALQKSRDRVRLVKESSKTFNCTYLYVNLLGNEAGKMIYEGEILVAKGGELIAINTETLSFNPFVLTSTVIDDGPAASIEEPDYDHPAYRFEEFTQALALGLHDYLRRCGAKGFVISLSGGADSSTCAVLVSEMVRRGIEALGYESFATRMGLDPSKELSQQEAVEHLLTCAYQATRNSSKETETAAKELANSIGAGFYRWSVDESVENAKAILAEALGREFSWENDDIALQNIQSRSRSPIIWMLANTMGSILITTGNRSEGDVGYATMDGDTSGSLAPIAGIDKPFILKWLRWAHENLGYEGLKYVLNLTPTAELRPTNLGQTDEADLMPYEILLEIEYHAIRDRLSPVETYRRMVETFSGSKDNLKSHITKFYDLWAKNQWKRERVAPAFHLDDFNIDPKTWMRFPILSRNFKEELEELAQLA